MDKVEAYNILQKEIQDFVSVGFQILKSKIDTTVCLEKTSENGMYYEIETQVQWQDFDKQIIRITSTIRDMNWYTYEPITESLTVQQSD